MTYTLPSLATTIADIPEVEIKTSKFVYNFYRKDEGSRDTGLLEKNFTNPFDFNEQVTSNVLRRLPRYNIITFAPHAVNFDPSTPVQPQVLKAQKDLNTNNILATNTDKIMSEDNFSNFNFVSIGLQDTGLDDKLFTLLKGALAVKIDNLKTTTIFKKAEFEQIPLPNELSFLDLAKLLSQLSTSEDQTITTTLADNTDLIAAIQDSVVTTQLNRKYMFTILNNVVRNPLTIFGDEFVNALSEAKNLQNSATTYAANDIANQLTEDGWNNFMKWVSAEELDPNKYKPARELLGYIISKSEILPSGETIDKEPLFVETPLGTTIIDPNVKYGTTYQYRISSIAIIKFQVIDITDPNDPKLFVIQALISSRPSKRIIISTTENIPPPPPADFRIEWDYTDNVPMLTWSFPTNSQRDIKYFQIFRRNSINEPFQLLQQYDFNDSTVLFPSGEFVEQELIKKVNPNIALTYFFDYEFTQNSTAIYALCCIDAHGLSSFYSAQYQITFNKFENKLKHTLISTQNAPKVLPNLLLQRDLFIDTIKTSGFEEVKIYFDPEYLKVSKELQFGIDKITLEPLAEDLNLWSTLQNSDNGRYVFQMINTDLQTQRNIQITINDLSSDQKLGKGT